MKHEGLKVKQKHENIFISIMNLKEEYLWQFDYNKVNPKEGGTLVFCDF